jgi:type II secretory pathway component PulF
LRLYRWKARDARGRPFEGECYAENKKEVADFVKKKYAYVTKITAARTGFNLLSILKKGGSFGTYEKIIFYKHLQMLLQSGIPLLKALHLLQLKTKHEGMRKTCAGLGQCIRKGQALSEGMQEHKHIFTPLDKVVIEAGEAGGVLTESFASLHAYYKQQYKIKKFLWQASLYPGILLGFSLAALLFFVIKIVPMFSDLYTSFAVEQTVGLRLLFTLRSLLVHNYYLLMVGTVLACLGLFKWRHLWVRLPRYLPFTGKLYGAYVEMRFLKLLSILLNSGVPLTETINLAGKSLQDDYLEKQSRLFLKQVVQGYSLANAATTVKTLFRETTITFIHVGENSGKLAEMLGEAADMLEQELQADIKNLKLVLEPVLLIIATAIIMALAITILDPIFSLITNLPEY